MVSQNRRMWLGMIAIISISPDVAAVGKIFTTLHNTDVNSTDIEVLYNETTRSEVDCGLICTKTPGCDMVRRQKGSALCIILSVPPAVHMPVERNFITNVETQLMIPEGVGWSMLFRATPGGGEVLRDRWLSAEGINSNNQSLATPLAQPPGIFKMDHLDELWPQFQKVKIAVYIEGVEQGWVAFTATGTNRQSWISFATTLASSYPDFMQNIGYRGLTGFNSRFLALMERIDCPRDATWLVVIDGGTGAGACSGWETAPADEYPIIYYSKLDTRGTCSNPDAVGKAEVLILYGYTPI